MQCTSYLKQGNTAQVKRKSVHNNIYLINIYLSVFFPPAAGIKRKTKHHVLFTRTCKKGRSETRYQRGRQQPTRLNKASFLQSPPADYDCIRRQARQRLRNHMYSSPSRQEQKKPRLLSWLHGGQLINPICDNRSVAKEEKNGTSVKYSVQTLKKK